MSLWQPYGAWSDTCYAFEPDQSKLAMVELGNKVGNTFDDHYISHIGASWPRTAAFADTYHPDLGLARCPKASKLVSATP